MKMSAPWTAAYSVTGTFDGLIPDAAYLTRAATDRPLTGPPRSQDAEPFEGWDRYCVPILDQRQTGMCQAFSSMIGLSTILRAKLSPYFLAGEIETVADDLCLDPRHGHRLAREAYRPREPYSPRDGVPAGASVDALRAAGLVSPGTTNRPIAWADIPARMADGLPELPLLITDAYDPSNMGKHGQIYMPRDLTAFRGGHSMRCVATARDPSGAWNLKLANSWRPWGVYGYAWIALATAEATAVDAPRLLHVSDPEWYANHDEWRGLLTLKTDLDAWLLRQ